MLVIYYNNLLRDYILWIFSYKCSCLDHWQDTCYLYLFVVSEDYVEWSETVINEET